MKNHFGTILASIILIGSLVSCARREETATTTAEQTTNVPVASAEATGELIGTLVSRDPKNNEATFDHQEVKGMMGAMKMAFEVRDAKVDSLPPDGSKVKAIAHEKDGKYWVTDVEKVE